MKNRAVRGERETKAKEKKGNQLVKTDSLENE